MELPHSDTARDGPGQLPGSAEGDAIVRAIMTCRDAILELPEQARLAVLSALASLFGHVLTPKPVTGAAGEPESASDQDPEWAEQFVAQVLLSDALMGAALRLDESKREIDTIAERLEQAVDDKSRELARSEERYSHLFNRVQEGIFACDSEGRFLDVNPAGLEMLGYGSKETLAAERTFDELFVEPSAEPFYTYLCKLEHVQNLEREIARPDGDRLHVLVTATLVCDDDSTPAGFEGILHDVTERQRLQESLIEAQQIEAVRRMVVTCCHEINQPLTVLCCHAQLLLEQCEHDSPHADIALAMSEEAAKLAEVMIKIGRIREIRSTKYIDGIDMLELTDSPPDQQEQQNSEN
jgi:PAS domain S-box-containing protein